MIYLSNINIIEKYCYLYYCFILLFILDIQ